MKLVEDTNNKILDTKKISDADIAKMSPMALSDPCTPGNPKKLNQNDMKIRYEHSVSGKLF